uniref:BTB domain-containing protein n=1 Tax=Branchiostoma floridae TaxID=7739 RepID=C3ZP11_BRAFL|eukprot:XP_002589735.1 hypothetical protein BRAFLDRAFT_97786 [Branchiostoma floridae]
MAAADQEHHVSVVCPRSYHDKSYLRGFLGTVGDLQKAGVLQDVVLEVGGRRFPCHRLVLSAASPYFRAMFTSDMAESRQKTVVLQGLDAGIFGEILSYIYSGTLHVSLDKVQPLYQAADLLQLDYMSETCSSYMVKNMKVECSNCVDLFNFADVFSLDIVRNRCLQCLHVNFAKVALSDEFCSLSVNQLTEIISHDELDVKEEITVWEAVVRWVQHSREERLHHLPSILPHIRFNLLTPDDTAAILEHPLVKEHPGSSTIRNVVKETEEELLFINPREGKYISRSFRPRRPYSFPVMAVTSDNNIYMLVSDLGVEEFDKLSAYKYKNSAVNNLHSLVGARMSTVSTFQRRDLYHFWYQQFLVRVEEILFYVAMGKTKFSTLIQMRKYDHHTDQWQECTHQELEQLDVPLGYGAAVSCGCHLYFIRKSDMHRYSPRQDLWEQRTPPRTDRSPATAVAMGTEIFCTDDLFTQTMVYDTESDIWQKLRGWSTQKYPSCLKISSPSFFVLENQLHIVLYIQAYGTARKGHYKFYVYDRD